MLGVLAEVVVAMVVVAVDIVVALAAAAEASLQLAFHLWYGSIYMVPHTMCHHNVQSLTFVVWSNGHFY